MQSDLRIRVEQLIVIAYQAVSERQRGITRRLYFLQKSRVIVTSFTKAYPDNVDVGLRYPPKRIEGIGCERFYVRAIKNINEPVKG